MSILLLLGLVFLFLYLLPFRGKRGRTKYLLSGAVVLLFAALLVLLIVGVLPWKFGSN